MKNAAHTKSMNTAAGPLAYLFTDLECTGLDEHRDEIIEFGVIGVDQGLNELFRFQTLIRPTVATIERIEEQPYVLAMTEANGLIEELRGAVGSWGLPSLSDVEDVLIGLIDTHGDGSKVTLAGSGVATYDFTFLKAQTPELAKKFTYFCNDVGDSRRRWRAATGGDLVPIDATKNHRAFDDVTIHLAEARYYRQLFAAIAASAGASDFKNIMAAISPGMKIASS
jgi:oligoribonuclease